MHFTGSSFATPILPTKRLGQKMFEIDSLPDKNGTAPMRISNIILGPKV
jgi:hypothetical protein